MERLTVSMRILIVEDDRYSREGLRDFLRGDGWTVQIYGDAWQAVLLARTCTIDIAIVDLVLPVMHGIPMTGWDLIRILRVYAPALPVVVVTAQERNSTLCEQAAALRVTEVLGKPIDPRYLKEVVRSLGASDRSPRTATQAELAKGVA